MSLNKHLSNFWLAYLNRVLKQHWAYVQTNIAISCVCFDLCSYTFCPLESLGILIMFELVCIPGLKALHKQEAKWQDEHMEVISSRPGEESKYNHIVIIPFGLFKADSNEIFA